MSLLLCGFVSYLYHPGGQYIWIELRCSWERRMAGAKRPFRIIGLADLHDCIGMLNRLQGIDADLIAFCGDLHNGGSRETALPTALALAGIGPPVIIVPGNMDHKDIVPELWREAGFKMLHCSSLMVEEIGFIGLGGMVARDARRLGHPARYYHGDEEVYPILAQCYQEIAGARFKIILSHQPPRGVQDTLYNGESSGSLGLRRFLEDFQPHLLLCGHIHEARGESLVGGCRVVNVGELRQGFAVIVEIGDEISVQWV
jgi:Icc-related predicted phosphoesterase